MSNYWLGKKNGKTRQYIEHKIKRIVLFDKCNSYFDHDLCVYIWFNPITQFESLLKLIDHGSYYHSDRKLYIDICNNLGMKKYVEVVISERIQKIRIILKDFVISDLINIIVECIQ